MRPLYLSLVAAGLASICGLLAAAEGLYVVRRHDIRLLRLK